MWGWTFGKRLRHQSIERNQHGPRDSLRITGIPEEHDDNDAAVFFRSVVSFNRLDKDDSHGFQVTRHELSQNVYISANLGIGSRLFHPFEINQDKNYILDFHGDLGPDKCYFNQYSHRLIESFNYFADETFNRNLLKYSI